MEIAMKKKMSDLTRRSFLSAGAAALVGAAAAKAGTELPRGGRDKGPMRVALAGCGARGMLLLEGLRTLATDGVPVRVAVVADEDSARRQAAAGLAGAAACGDWRDCAGRRDVDGVIIALPDDLHAPAALEALKSGKHVYMETPVARSGDEARVLAQAARVSGAVIEVGAAECALPAWRLAADLVRSGRIGRVHGCHSVAACGIRGGAAGWRGERGRSQGLAAQLHYDQIMPLLQALHPGPATSASTAGGRWDGLGGTPDSLMSTIHFGEGLTANLVSSALNTTGQRPMLRGDLGSIEVCTQGVLLMPERGPEQWIPAPSGPLAAEQLLLRDWVEAVRSGQPPLCPLSLGLASQTAVDLCLAAYGDGKAAWQA